MADRYLDLSPPEAVALARAEADWDYLDRYLRSRVIAYLQDRTGEGHELRAAILEAVRWARAESRSPWEATWPFMLELLQDAERHPSTAQDLGMLAQPEGRAVEVLQALASHAKPMRPRDLTAELGISAQHLGNVSRRLEEGRLIARRKAEGRATWLFATARGFRLAASLPGVRPAAERREDEARLAPEIAIWNERAMTKSELKIA